MGRWKTQSMHDGRRDFNYAGRNILPWVTAGYGAKAHSTPDALRNTLMEFCRLNIQNSVFTVSSRTTCMFNNKGQWGSFVEKSKFASWGNSALFINNRVEENTAIK